MGVHRKGREDLFAIPFAIFWRPLRLRYSPVSIGFHNVLTAHPAVCRTGKHIPAGLVRWSLAGKVQLPA